MHARDTCYATEECKELQIQMQKHQPMHPFQTSYLHALSSLPLCLVLFLPLHSPCLPSDPPPGEKEGKRGSTKYRHFPPPSSPASLSLCLSLKTTAVIPNACQGATELVSVHVDVCAASGPDQDTHSLCCWLRFLPVNCQEILKHAI